MSFAKKTESLYDHTVMDAKGENKIDLGGPDYRGKVVLVVNVASQCGLTKDNYTQLSHLADRWWERGLRVLLFPCNQFASQEPGPAASVCEFVRASDYSTKLVVAEKVDVNGSSTHPLYAWLKKACPGFIFNAIKWNFTKFLIDRNGKPVKRFGPNENPSSFESAIVELLDATPASPSNH